MGNNADLHHAYEYGISDDPKSVKHLFTFSDKDFRDEIWRILLELKGSKERMGRTTNKNQF